MRASAVLLLIACLALPVLISSSAPVRAQSDGSSQSNPPPQGNQYRHCEHQRDTPTS